MKNGKNNINNYEVKKWEYIRMIINYKDSGTIIGTSGFARELRYVSQIDIKEPHLIQWPEAFRAFCSWK
jgi:hypothetical protein